MTILTYRYRVKNLNGLLNRQSRAVNFVWNFCNDRQTGELMASKVGISGDPENRVTDIHHKLRRDGLRDFTLDLRYCVTIVNAGGLERAVHRALDNELIQNEWFDVTPERAIAEVVKHVSSN